MFQIENTTGLLKSEWDIIAFVFGVD